MYGDFQCPFCAAAQAILRRVRERLEGRLRFAFRHFPLEEMPPGRAAGRRGERGGRGPGPLLADARRALRGARAARGSRTSCAPPGRSPGSTSTACARSSSRARTRARVERDVGSGRDVGRPGTPTFFVNGARHSGAFDAQALIAALEGREAA